MNAIHPLVSQNDDRVFLRAGHEDGQRLHRSAQAVDHHRHPQVGFRGFGFRVQEFGFSLLD